MTSPARARKFVSLIRKLDESVWILKSVVLNEKLVDDNRLEFELLAMIPTAVAMKYCSCASDFAYELNIMHRIYKPSLNAENLL